MEDNTAQLQATTATPVGTNVPNLDLPNIEEASLTDISGAYDAVASGLASMGTELATDISARQRQLIGNNFGPIAGNALQQDYLNPGLASAGSQIRVAGTQKALGEGMRRAEEAAKARYQKAQSRYNNYQAYQTAMRNRLQQSAKEGGATVSGTAEGNSGAINALAGVDEMTLEDHVAASEKSLEATKRAWVESELDKVSSIKGSNVNYHDTVFPLVHQYSIEEIEYRNTMRSKLWDTADTMFKAPSDGWQSSYNTTQGQINSLIDNIGTLSQEGGVGGYTGKYYVTDSNGNKVDVTRAYLEGATFGSLSNNDFQNLAEYKRTNPDAYNYNMKLAYALNNNAPVIAGYGDAEFLVGMTNDAGETIQAGDIIMPTFDYDIAENSIGLRKFKQAIKDGQPTLDADGNWDFSFMQSDSATVAWRQFMGEQYAALSKSAAFGSDITGDLVKQVIMELATTSDTMKVDSDKDGELTDADKDVEIYGQDYEKQADKIIVGGVTGKEFRQAFNKLSYEQKQEVIMGCLQKIENSGSSVISNLASNARNSIARDMGGAKANFHGTLDPSELTSGEAEALVISAYHSSQLPQGDRWMDFSFKDLGAVNALVNASIQEFAGGAGSLGSLVTGGIAWAAVAGTSAIGKGFGLNTKSLDETAGDVGNWAVGNTDNWGDYLRAGATQRFGRDAELEVLSSIDPRFSEEYSDSEHPIGQFIGSMIGFAATMVPVVGPVTDALSMMSKGVRSVTTAAASTKLGSKLFTQGFVKSAMKADRVTANIGRLALNGGGRISTSVIDDAVTSLSRFDDVFPGLAEAMRGSRGFTPAERLIYQSANAYDFVKAGGKLGELLDSSTWVRALSNSLTTAGKTKEAIKLVTDAARIAKTTGKEVTYAQAIGLLKKAGVSKSVYTETAFAHRMASEVQASAIGLSLDYLQSHRQIGDGEDQISGGDWFMQNIAMDVAASMLAGVAGRAINGARGNYASSKITALSKNLDAAKTQFAQTEFGTKAHETAAIDYAKAASKLELTTQKALAADIAEGNTTKFRELSEQSRRAQDDLLGKISSRLDVAETASDARSLATALTTKIPYKKAWIQSIAALKADAPVRLAELRNDFPTYTTMTGREFTKSVVTFFDVLDAHPGMDSATVKNLFADHMQSRGHSRGEALKLMNMFEEVWDNNKPLLAGKTTKRKFYTGLLTSLSIKAQEGGNVVNAGLSLSRSLEKGQIDPSMKRNTADERLFLQGVLDQMDGKMRLMGKKEGIEIAEGTRVLPQDIDFANPVNSLHIYMNRVASMRAMDNLRLAAFRQGNILVGLDTAQLVNLRDRNLASTTDKGPAGNPSKYLYELLTGTDADGVTTVPERYRMDAALAKQTADNVVNGTVTAGSKKLLTRALGSMDKVDSFMKSYSRFGLDFNQSVRLTGELQMIRAQELSGIRFSRSLKDKFRRAAAGKYIGEAGTVAADINTARVDYDGFFGIGNNSYGFKTEEVALATNGNGVTTAVDGRRVVPIGQLEERWLNAFKGDYDAQADILFMEKDNLAIAIGDNIYVGKDVPGNGYVDAWAIDNTTHIKLLSKKNGVDNFQLTLKNYTDAGDVIEGKFHENKVVNTALTAMVQANKAYSIMGELGDVSTIASGIELGDAIKMVGGEMYIGKNQVAPGTVAPLNQVFGNNNYVGYLFADAMNAIDNKALIDFSNNWVDFLSNRLDVKVDTHAAYNGKANTTMAPELLGEKMTTKPEGWSQSGMFASDADGNVYIRDNRTWYKANNAPNGRYTAIEIYPREHISDMSITVGHEGTHFLDAYNYRDNGVARGSRRINVDDAYYSRYTEARAHAVSYSLYAAKNVNVANEYAGLNALGYIGRATDDEILTAAMNTGLDVNTDNMVAYADYAARENYATATPDFIRGADGIIYVDKTKIGELNGEYVKSATNTYSDAAKAYANGKDFDMTTLKDADIYFDKDYNDMANLHKKTSGDDTVEIRLRDKVGSAMNTIQQVQLALGYSVYNAYTFRQALTAFWDRLFHDPAGAMNIMTSFWTARNARTTASFFNDSATQSKLHQVIMRSGDTQIIDALNDGIALSPEQSTGVLADMSREWRNNRENARLRGEGYALNKNLMAVVHRLTDEPTFNRFVPIMQTKMLLLDYDGYVKKALRKIGRKLDTFGTMAGDAAIAAQAADFAYDAYVMFWKPQIGHTKKVGKLGHRRRLGLTDANIAARTQFLSGEQRGLTLGNVMGKTMFAVTYRATMLSRIMNAFKSLSRSTWRDARYSGPRSQMMAMLGLVMTAQVWNALANGYNDIEDVTRGLEAHDPNNLVRILTGMQRLAQIDLDGRDGPKIDPFFSLFTLSNTMGKAVAGAWNLFAPDDKDVVGTQGLIQEGMSLLLSPIRGVGEIFFGTYYGYSVWGEGASAIDPDTQEVVPYDPLKNAIAISAHILGLDTFLDVHGSGEAGRNARGDYIGGSGILQHEAIDAGAALLEGNVFKAIVTALELPIKFNSVTNRAKSELNSYVVKAIRSFKSEYDTKVANASSPEEKDKLYEEFAKKSLHQIDLWNNRYGILTQSDDMIRAAHRVILGMLSDEFSPDENRLKNAYWAAKIDVLGGFDKKATETDEEYAERKARVDEAYGSQMDKEYAARQVLSSLGYDMPEYGQADLTTSYYNNKRAVVAQFKAVASGEVSGYPDLESAMKSYKTQISAARNANNRALANKLEADYINLFDSIVGGYIEEYGYGVLTNNYDFQKEVAKYVMIPSADYRSYTGEFASQNWMQDHFGVGFRKKSNLLNDSDYMEAWTKFIGNLNRGEAGLALSRGEDMLARVAEGKYSPTSKQYNQLVQLLSKLRGGK